MIENIMTIVLNFVIGLVTIILYPLDILIQTFLPHLDFAFSYINSLIDLFINFVPFVADMTFISPQVLGLIADFIIFKYSARIGAYSVKLALSWYDTLKG